MMRIGTAQLDITPAPGVELSGFAARAQPSTGVQDRLYARAIHLCDRATRLLWIHCDVIGFDEELIHDFVGWARTSLGLAPSEVLLSATHTHSGPCTLRLEGAGRYDRSYAGTLTQRLHELARRAVASPEVVCAVTAAEDLVLAVDRRHGGRSRAGLQVAAVGFVREDETFAAVLTNYPIHPVALGPRNCRISADIPGQAAHALAIRLPGNPVALVTNGACGDLNPPAENVSSDQAAAWGRAIAHAVAPRLVMARERATTFSLANTTVSLPLEVLTRDQIERFAAGALQDPTANAEWGAKYREVVATWRRTQLDAVARGDAIAQRAISLTALRFGETYFLTVNAEIFSEFNDRLREATGRDVHTVGCANGSFGYIATRAAYAEGGYEVDRAHLFYGGFRFQAGGLETLVTKAADLLNTMAGRHDSRAVPAHANHEHA